MFGKKSRLLIGVINKVKIGIISEFSKNTINYGNNLQAYALNRYLRKIYSEHQIETIYFKNERKYKITLYIEFAIKVIKKIVSSFRKRRRGKFISKQFLMCRKSAFQEFVRKNITLCPAPMNWTLLIHSDYDLFIVGSDVVWEQAHFGINRIKFLDFTNTKKAKKASYAASFGRDWIPRNNQKWIRKYLGDFLCVSVREYSSVQLLNSIGISNVVHTLDPILLIDADEWSSLESRPEERLDVPYVFVYLLGMDAGQRRHVERLCRREGLAIVTIPYAGGVENEVDKTFGDVRLMDCSPEEWIWLIHHAEIIITDSFHGTVFSTIFKKKFLVIRRELDIDINNRMDDYLRTISQSDKKVDLSGLDSLSGKTWDYDTISSLIAGKKKESMKYLDDLIRMADGKGF